MKIIEGIKKNTIFLILITLLVLFLILKDNLQNTFNALLNLNCFWIIIALLCYFLYLLFTGWSLYIVSKKEKENIKFWNIFKLNIVIQFFNGITPFSTGGQPVQIYLLKKQGIKMSRGTNVVIQNFMFYQIALVFYGLMAILFNFIFKFFTNAPVLRGLILLGFLVNTFVVIVLFLVIFSNKINKKFLNKFIGLLARWKIVKNKEEKLEKWNNRLDEFNESARQLRKNKDLFIKGILSNFIGLTFFYIIPLFVAFSMNRYTDINIINTLVCSAYILMMGSFVPIPGASGGIEYGFLQFFGNYFPSEVLSAILIVWRFITYYLGMIVGGIMFSVDKGEVKE